ncbi:hypothetical protein FIBSPDRAFT_865314 [Athelia psychrophila]|uniref:Uncharacterized protein n=1 Tax=Athelia psychrophila TaxID=1759441 RepID=A0A166FMI6_9AGAM|nr:hypothetical protein FIBSPDRAFT_865314 [Fibularhizoctonia sp. CBS 109695]
MYKPWLHVHRQPSPHAHFQLLRLPTSARSQPIRGPSPYAIPACTRARQPVPGPTCTRQPALMRAAHPYVSRGRSYVRTPSSTRASPPAVHTLPSRAGAHPDPPTRLSSAYADIRVRAA